jgi:hypothetical protein
MKGAAPDESFRTAPDADALASPSVSQALRMRVVAAVQYGGAFARQVADEIADMVDDGRLTPAVGAAILRVIALEPAQGGDFQVGLTGPLDSPPDNWGEGGNDLWGGGGKQPARRDVAPPSHAFGYLFPPSGKGRALGTMREMPPRGALSRSEWTSEELEKICRMIRDWPGDGAPDVQKIYEIVRRERRLGLPRA